MVRVHAVRETGDGEFFFGFFAVVVKGECVVGVVVLEVELDLSGQGFEGRFYEGACFCGEGGDFRCCWEVRLVVAGVVVLVVV